jgi:hypothetical protein
MTSPYYPHNDYVGVSKEVKISADILIAMLALHPDPFNMSENEMEELTRKCVDLSDMIIKKNRS